MIDSLNGFPWADLSEQDRRRDQDLAVASRQTVPGMVPHQSLDYYGQSAESARAQQAHSMRAQAEAMRNTTPAERARLLGWASAQANQLARDAYWLVTTEEAFFRRLIAWGMARSATPADGWMHVGGFSEPMPDGEPMPPDVGRYEKVQP